MASITPLHKAEYYDGTYRTNDGNCQFDFKCERPAGGSTWSVWVRYGDARITNYPNEYFNIGLAISANTQNVLLDQLSKWSEAIWEQFNPDKRIIPQTTPSTKLEVQ